MHEFSVLPLLVVLLFHCSLVRTLPQDPSFSLKRDNHNKNRERADAVRAAFQIVWNGYQTYAFPHDELHPVDNTYRDPRYNVSQPPLWGYMTNHDQKRWGASAIDGLDTAIVMQLPDIVDFILGYVPSINFAVTTTQSSTPTQVSLFETTIRYLGGMLTAYDLLKGPLAFVASNSSAVDTLLAQSKRLADDLKFAFDSPTGIPSNNLYLENKTTDGSNTNGLATIGTLVLEWTHLSDLTGDPEYAELSQKGESYLLNPKFQPPLSGPFPGLLGTNVNITTGLFQDAAGGWNGGDDSYYEYLIKMRVYDSNRFSKYRDHWIQAADSSIAYLASYPSSRPDLTFLAAFTSKELQYNSGHLACFAGGNFLLGGAVLHEQKYIDFGLALVNACHDTYTSTLTDIGPESFSRTVNGTSGVPASQPAFYERAGFYITNSVYVLRPEVMGELLLRLPRHR